MRTAISMLIAVSLLVVGGTARGESHAGRATEQPPKHAVSIRSAAPWPDNLWQLERDLEESGTAEEIRALIARVDEESRKPQYERWMFIGDRERLLEILLERGGPKEFDEVLTTFDGLSSDDRRRSSYLSVLLRAKLRSVVQSALQAPPPRFTSDQKDPIPDHLKAASARLISRWRYYRGLAGTAPEPQVTHVAIQDNWPSFYKRVSDLLHSKPGEHYAALAPFVWGGTCGTGSDTLYEPKSIAQFIALVERGDLARAALLPVTQGWGLYGRPDWHGRFVEWTSIQLTRARVGETLDRHSFTWPDPAPRDSEVDEYALDLAAMDGLFTSLQDRSSLLWRIEKLLTPNPKKPVVVSPAIEHTLIDLLVREASQEPPLPTRDVALRILANLKRPGTAEVLRLGLTSTGYGVADAVSTALESMPGGVPRARVEGDLAVHLNAGALSLVGMNVKYLLRAAPNVGSKDGSCVMAEGNICRIPRAVFATAVRPVALLEIDSPTLRQSRSGTFRRGRPTRFLSAGAWNFISSRSDRVEIFANAGRTAPSWKSRPVRSAPATTTPP